MTENEKQQPERDLDGAGLSATGHTADEMGVGERREGETYSDPAGLGTAHKETTQGEPDSDLGQPPPE